MKKWILLSVVLGAASLSGYAQDDDLYFVPTKKNVEKEKATYGIPSSTYYSGSQRSVDEYNRRNVGGSSYEVLPADTGDIISFAPIEGIYPDSTDTDFALTRRMERWDDYEPSADYWAGYAQGRNDSWGWHSPWYFSSGYYPWYSSYWYDPWYWDYGWGWGWYGAYSPWYSWRWGWGGYYGSWYHPWYYSGWGGGHYVANRYPNGGHYGRVSGSGPRGYSNGRTHTYSAGTFGSSRSAGSFGGGRSTIGSTTRTRTSAGSGTYSNSNGNFGGSRSGSTYTPTRSSSSGSSGGSFGGSRSSGGSSGGGSFGGSRSSGGGGGGSRSGGGGFGGGRR